MGNLDFTISVLEEDEDILASLNCNLKSFIDFTIVDQDGVLLVTNKRVLFCKYKGRDLSVVHDFEYKLITSFNVKEDDYKNKYIIFKYKLYKRGCFYRYGIWYKSTFYDDCSNYFK